MAAIMVVERDPGRERASVMVREPQRARPGNCTELRGSASFDKLRMMGFWRR